MKTKQLELLNPNIGVMFYAAKLIALIKSVSYFLYLTMVLRSDEFSFVFLRRLRFGDGRRPIAL
jgi:hypothetical protein